MQLSEIRRCFSQDPLFLGLWEIKSHSPKTCDSTQVTSVKVSQWLHQELDLEDAQEFFWSNSKVVLGYIGNETRRFHIFVANRVQLIQEATSAEQWGYVDSKANPADDASRGLSPSEFLSSRWVLGPEFLWKDESQWPSNVEPKDQVFTQRS